MSIRIKFVISATFAIAAGVAFAQPSKLSSEVAAKQSLVIAAIEAGDLAAAMMLSTQVHSLISNEMRRALPTPQERLSKAESSLALRVPADPNVVIYFLYLMPQTAFDAGDYAKAAFYASKLSDAIRGATKTPGIYGDAMFEANTIKGQLALKDGDVSGAKLALLESVSAAEYSHGLKMATIRYDLASALLAAGERETVVQFLQICDSFRPKDHDKYSVWIAAIKGGANPKLTIF